MTYSHRPFSRCTQPDALGLHTASQPHDNARTSAQNAVMGTHPTLPQHCTWQFALSQAHARYWSEGS
ncbi:hypothetical protein V5T82_06440 [Magnetovibrio sp. PR-2]|uniref:hypothetical protein n=1 Tax=Magnetovibrio sp. PR-2 TaxID=3120356 RepID=UPI002FCE56FF